MYTTMASLPKPLILCTYTDVSHHISITYFVRVHRRLPSHLHHLKRNIMPVRCHCSTCNRTLVPGHVKRNHDRAALKNQTISQQSIRQPDPASTDTIEGGSSVTVPVHLHNALPSLHMVDSSSCTSSPFVDPEDGALSCPDIDVITPHANYDNCLGADPVDSQFSKNDNHPAEEDQGELACKGAYDEKED